MKVFSHYPYQKMWKFSKQKDNEQHSFIRLDYDNQTIIGFDTSYLFECGVLNTFIFAWVFPQPSDR